MAEATLELSSGSSIDEPLQVPINRAAMLLGVCRQTLYRMRDNGEIAFGRMRGRTFVPVAELKRFKSPDEVRRFLAKSVPKKKRIRPMLYFVDCGEFTKIGFTAKGTESRMAGIASGNPFDLYVWGTVPGDLSLEREMHVLFARYRHRNEWFRLDNEARAQAARKIRELGGKINSTNYWRAVWRNSKNG